MGGSSKKQTVGHKYYLGMHVALCHGPVDKIHRIRVDEKNVWTGSNEGGSIQLNSEKLFGGKRGEGGISGTVDFEQGGPAQGVNSYLSGALQGGLVPAFRGICAMVMRQVYVGNSPYLKPWDFRLQRIHVRQDAVEQWYDAKAEVPNPSVLLIDPTVGQSDTPYRTDYIDIHSMDNAVDIQQPIEPPNHPNSKGITLSGYATTDVIRITANVDNNPAFISWSPWGTPAYTGPGSGTAAFYYYIKDGDINTETSVGASGIYDGYEAARDALIAEDPDILFNASSYTFYIQDEFIDDNTGGLSLTVEAFDGVLQKDMNPAHIVRECLTDPDWGMGYQEADIDDASFTASADTLYDESMGISILWDRQIPIEDFIKEILKHIDASLYIDRTTGKFVLKLVRDDYVESDLIILGPGNVESIEGFSLPSTDELINTVTVQYWDSASSKDGSVTISDTALVQMQGITVGQTMNYPGFTNRQIASRVAQRDLRALSTPLASCTIYANRDAADLNIGDAFKLTWPDYDLNELVMRVTNIALGDGRSNRIRINATQDVFATPTVLVVTEQPSEWESPSNEATAALGRIIQEAPYYELVKAIGQDFADDLLTARPEAGFLSAAAIRPTSDALEAILSVDSGAGYEESATLEFAPWVLVTDDLAQEEETTVAVSDSEIDDVVVGTFGQIGTEIVKVLAVSTSSITIGRGALDTVPVAHDAGYVVLWEDFGESDGVEYAAGESIDVKLLTVTGIDTLTSTNAPVDSLTFDSRAARPYPPGNLKVNGEYYPEAIEGDAELALTWAHRDRTQQTSGELADFTDSDIGPETNVTYTLRIYGEEDTLGRTETGLATTSYTYDAEDEKADFELPSGELTCAVQPEIDPDDASVSALLHFNGTDGGTTFTDEGGNTWTANGNAQLDTDEKRFGSAAGLFDGTGDYIDTPHDAKFNIESGDFTIEAWVYRAADGAVHNILNKRSDDPATGWGLRIGSNDKLLFFHTAGSTVESLSTIPSGAWAHVAATRSGTTVRLFINGELDNSGTVTNGTPNTATTLKIGTDQLLAFGFNGWIDELRITKGVARYTEDFLIQCNEFGSAFGGAFRLNGHLRFELESVRDDGEASDDKTSFQYHDVTVRRAGYGFSYGYNYGGLP